MPKRYTSSELIDLVKNNICFSISIRCISKSETTEMIQIILKKTNSKTEVDK